MIFWLILISIVCALFGWALLWPERREVDSYYASLGEQDQLEWCTAFADRVQEQLPTMNRVDAWSAACGSYPTMSGEDPVDSADVEMSYWD